MSKTATRIELTEEERQELERVVRTQTAPHRSVQRAEMVLLAAEGWTNTAIALAVGLSRAMVVQWRQRFAERRMAGLQDELRSGKPPRYDADTERRIPRQVCKAIDRFTAARNEHPAPFEWTKRVVHQGPLNRAYSDLCN